MSEVFRPSRVVIHLDRLRQNCRQLMGMVDTKTFFCPMIKANAYGHGDLQVARALQLEGVRTFGVALLEEAVRLREMGLKDCELLVFSPCLNQQTLATLVTHQITPVLSTWAEVHALIRNQHHMPEWRIHIKFNTGMNRLGFDLEDAVRLASVLKSESRIRVVGICSHFLAGEDLYVQGHSYSQLQLQYLGALRKIFDAPYTQFHMFNSSSSLAFYTHNNRAQLPMGLRPGIAIYGVKPQVHYATSTAQEMGEAFALRPVMEVKSKIIHTHKVKKGSTVSYGAVYMAPTDEWIGVLPIGYADGYMRNFSAKSHAICRGEKIPVTGIVCMDYTMVRLKDRWGDAAQETSNSIVGEDVILLGEAEGQQILAEELAQLAHTNAYEVLTQMSARMPREYK